MATSNTPNDLAAGQMPLDMRIASFLAGIQVDSASSDRSHTDQGSTASFQNEPTVPTSAVHDQTSLALENAPCTTPTRGSRNPSSRKRRYRDDRQKLSNSLAQKRYRERKKRAFDNMKSLVDSLTVEVERLQTLKRENEKLTLELEEYRHLANVHGMSRKRNKSTEGSSQTKETALDVGTADCPSTVQILQGDGAGRLFSAQNVPLADWIETMTHVCQGSCSLQIDPSVDLQTRIKSLEKEWHERMMTIEHLMQMRPSFGPMGHGTTEHLVPVLRSCMTNMYYMSSDIACLKMQQLSQRMTQLSSETQGKNERIQKAFLFLHAPK